MTQTQRERSDRVRAYLLASTDLSEPEKDQLQSYLDQVAEAANGHPDKIQAISDVLQAMVEHQIKKEVREPARIALAAAEAVAKHVEGCPLRGRNAGMPAWAAWLFPFRWPLAVAAFAPGAPGLLRIALSACGVKGVE
jgi:hypothetical protein